MIWYVTVRNNHFFVTITFVNNTEEKDIVWCKQRITLIHSDNNKAPLGRALSKLGRKERGRERVHSIICKHEVSDI